ncbi:hypothetical protein FRC20_010852 [Serendipita sp. 405]|nr:hypothetical protein FRC16_010968 [Serendipita sp. 398]KAG8863226.1 hypothetical protein FRC20_010852 [Serendipita sp. 405]
MPSPSTIRRIQCRHSPPSPCPLVSSWKRERRERGLRLSGPVAQRAPDGPSSRMRMVASEPDWSPQDGNYQSRGGSLAEKEKKESDRDEKDLLDREPAGR